MLTGNKLSLFFCTSLIILLSSCRQQYDKSLVHIDSLSDTNADSAQSLLTAFDTTAVPTSDLMYYRLLQIKVNDKLDSLKYSNEEAEQLVTNFEEKGNEQLLPTAYYYGGRICAENKNAPQALNYFRKAETLLKEHDDNPALLSKVYSQMGYIFLYRNMYEEARNYSSLSYKIDESIKDTIGTIFNLRDIGTSLVWSGNSEAALPYYAEARRLSVITNNRTMWHDLEMSMAEAYHKCGQNELANYYAKRILKDVTSSDSSAVLSIVSAIYYDTMQKDSAEILLNQLLSCGTKPAQCYAHEKLAEICMQKSNAVQAMYHYKHYQSLRDSLDKIYNTTAIAIANSAYNYQEKEAENYQLKISNERKSFLIFIFFGLLIISFFVIILSIKRSKQRQTAKLKKLKQIKNELRLQSEKYISENKHRIKELEEQLLQSTTLSDELKKQLENEKEKLQFSNEFAKLKNKENERSLNNIRQTAIFRLFMKQAEHDTPQKISKENWEELENVIKQEYKDFKSNLNNLCNPTLTEYRVCLLLKAHVEPVKIAVIIMRAKNSVSSIRSRLYQKAFGCKGSAKDWDEVIYSL